MNLPRRLLILPFIVLTCTTTFAAPPKVILTVPYVITVPGTYQLSKNLAYAGIGSAITVNTSDVTIDLKGFILRSAGNFGVTNDNSGIASINRKNITIRNGTIRGFSRGVYISGSDEFGGHLIEGVRAEGCTFLGIQAKGRYTTVRHCTVTDVGGATWFTGFRYGIHITGLNSRVLDNDVLGVRADTANLANRAYGILLLSSGNSLVEDNRVFNSDVSITLQSIGIVLDNSDSSGVINNRIARHITGLFITNDGSSKYRDNFTTNCATSFDVTGNATNAGNNN